MRTFILACLIFSACGEDVTADQGCAAVAQGFCGKIDQCAHPLIATQYGSVSACVTRQKANCLNGLKAPGNSVTPAKAKTCGDAVAGISCTDAFTRNLPKSCVADPGMLADGTACGQDGQCKSTYCKKATSDAACGTCGPRSAAGGACQRSDDCNLDLACANMVCTQWVGAGGTCDGAHPCATPLICKTGTCGMAAGPGQACMRQADCDQTQGLFCNGVTGGVCQMILYANAGQACGISANPINLTVCTASSTCSAQTNGTCVAPAADGASCGTGNVSCTPPATCTNNLCKIPDFTTCH